MLWRKGWLESRFRWLIGLLFGGFYLVSGLSYGIKTPAALTSFLGSEWLIVAMISCLVAGAGIATQPELQATKGLHGSMLFTLCLPVSRFRLLVVRASLGWLETAASVVLLCIGMWTLVPLIREVTTPGEMVLHAASLIVCVTGLYAIPVLLSTFLDDQWRVWGSALIVSGLSWLANRVALPAPINIFRAMGQDSLLLTHAIPWVAMACSLALAAVLLAAALKIAQRREY